jgi:seryl-tRNA synthetase
MTHPAVRGLREPRLMRQRPFAAPDYPLRSFEEISRILGGARLENLSLVSGERSYHLMGPLAQLELALVNWAVEKLLQEARVGNSLILIFGSNCIILKFKHGV